MSRTLISRDDVAAAAKSGQPSDGMLRKSFVAEKIESIEGVDRTLKFIISTNAVDRDNDTVNALGWMLDNFKKNPVVLWAHDYSQLPVGKCTQLGVEGGQLVATAEFATHAFAETVYQMLKGRFLNATSVGFAPKTYKMNEERGGLDFETQELLEFSIVPVPANPEALMLASAAGIDATPVKEWAEAVLKSLAGPASPAPTVAKAQPAGEPAAQPTPAKAPAETPTEAPAEAVAPAAEAPAPAGDAPEAKDTPAPVAKRGRVLSSANEGRLRRAKDILEEVLAQIERAPIESPGDEEPRPVAARESVDPPPTKDGLGTCEFMDAGDNTACTMTGTETCVNCGAVYCAHHASPHGTCMSCMGTLEDERTLAVELGDEPEVALVLRETDIVIDLDGASDEAVELSFDPDELRAAMREQVAELVGQAVRAEATAALNRARGRVD